MRITELMERLDYFLQTEGNLPVYVTGEQDYELHGVDVNLEEKRTYDDIDLPRPKCLGLRVG